METDTSEACDYFLLVRDGLHQRDGPALAIGEGWEIDYFNSVWPGDAVAIWWHWSGSALAHVMAWCHQAPSHCLNQQWLKCSWCNLLTCVLLPGSSELTHEGLDKMIDWHFPYNFILIFYPRPVLAFGYCRWLRLSVCVCGKHLLVRAITCHAFKLESPNLDHKSKTPWLRSLLFWGVNDLELQGQI